MKNILILSICFAGLFLLYRSCTSGYQDYGYFIRVNDEAVFQAALSGSDKRIAHRGRKLLEQINRIDRESDRGNGPDKGIVRWYRCSGIDCDEGWQHSFLTEK